MSLKGDGFRKAAVVHRPTGAFCTGTVVMRHKANDPVHDVETYVWGGIHKGWLDREQAKAAGL